jgi:hypothetical protein
LWKGVSFLPQTQANFYVLSIRLDHVLLRQLIAQLALSVGHLSDALNSSAHEVKLMNIAQSNAVQAADGLVAALQQMNETAMSALLDINATAIRVSQAIGVGYYSFFSNFLSLAGAIFLYCEDDRIPPASKLTISNRPLHSETNFSSAPGCVYGRCTTLSLFHCHGRPPSSAACLCLDDCLQPCIVAILSMLRWSLKKILTRQRFRYPRPCVCSFKASSESNQTSAAHLSPVTLTARATPWVRRRAFGWRSSQFSRIPDRLCGRRLDE